MVSYSSVNMPFVNLCESYESYGGRLGMKAQLWLVGHWDGEVDHAFFHGGNASLDEQDDG